MKRLNITLPEEIVHHLEGLPNKSRFISEAVQEKLMKEKKKKLDELLKEGYRTERKEDRKLNKEWERITIEGW
ncbi:MAG: hypothetical protein NC905_01370 [Candidatus Omnitrophica bacterium]|nr:hypothetical protein [Candidatus Omnitrophota bacterium]MCM8776903.1 hypothetical protein [Candidatus Omnitrophota bacterium]